MDMFTNRKTMHSRKGRKLNKFMHNLLQSALRNHKVHINGRYSITSDNTQNNEIGAYLIETHLHFPLSITTQNNIY